MVASRRHTGARHALVEGVGRARGPVHHGAGEEVVVGGVLHTAVQLARVLTHNYGYISSVHYACKCEF